MFSDSATLPTLGDTRISAGIIFALVAVAIYFWVLNRTRWGYKMRVIGGNAEAARRSGIRINRYIIMTMVIGGAMAGLSGMIEVTAIQGRLRGGITNGYGYIGFLVAWIALQKPDRDRDRGGAARRDRGRRRHAANRRQPAVLDGQYPDGADPVLHPAQSGRAEAGGITMDPLMFIQFVLTGAIRSATPVLYTALGETVSEKAGIVNLGAEGSMLMGACIGFIVTAQTGSGWLGAGAGALAGGLISLLHAYLVINCRANQLASGLTVMFFGLGLTGLIGRPYVSAQIQGFDVLPIPILSDIPFIGKIFFQHDVLTYLGYLLIPAIWFFLYKTRWGLSLRAVGESRAAAFSTGRNPALIAYGAVFFGGLMAGLGGAQLSTFGPDVPDDVKAATDKAVDDITSGALYPFEGPIYKQDGSIAIAEGDKPDTPTLETTDYLVKGVVGTIPQ